MKAVLLTQGGKLQARDTSPVTRVPWGIAALHPREAARRRVEVGKVRPKNPKETGVLVPCCLTLEIGSQLRKMKMPSPHHCCYLTNTSYGGKKMAWAAQKV